MRKSRIDFALKIAFIVLLCFGIARAMGLKQHEPFTSLNQIGSVPTSDFLNALVTKPDGTPCQSPCAFGVQLGKTTFNDAIEIMKTHPYIAQRFKISKSYQDQNSRDQNFDSTSSDFTLNIRAAGTDNTVDMLTIGKITTPSMARSITPSKEMPTLAQLLTSWGNPTGISFFNYRYNSQSKEFYYIVGFHYHRNGNNTFFSIAYSPESPIRPEDRPYYIFISTYNPYDPGGGPWHGFGSINDYLNYGDADVQFKYLCCA